jgi:hypothetical protein
MKRSWPLEVSHLAELLHGGHILDSVKIMYQNLKSPKKAIESNRCLLIA